MNPNQINTSRSKQIAKIIKKRQPLGNRIKRVEANLESLELALFDLEKQCNQLFTRGIDAAAARRLGEIDFPGLLGKISAELQVLEKLNTRFSRKTLNIGVVGRARQGKSRLLRSLTGLTATKIPDGNQGFCTGVRSKICHKSGVTAEGKVWFYSERAFLDEVIGPYYEKLRLGPKPMSIKEFVKNEPPFLPEDMKDVLSKNIYGHLRKDYYANREKYYHLLEKQSPLEITGEQIREYVTQDYFDSNGERIVNYLAVQEVEIFCPFPNAEVGDIALVDLPGLGDTNFGDEERLMKTLKQDIDFVLFVRKPISHGDDWTDYDVNLYQKAHQALSDIPIRLWSFMVLNRTDAGKDSDNLERCKSLAGNIAEKHIEVQSCVIADCANEVEANTKVLDPVLDYLVGNITALDELYARSCQKRLEQLHGEVRVELDKAQKALAQYGDEDSMFGRLFKQFWWDLTSGLEDLRRHLKEQSNAEDPDLKAKVGEAIQNCRRDTGIPSVEEIEQKYKHFGSYDMAYYQYLHELRTHLSKHFLLLNHGLKKSIERIKSEIIGVLAKQGLLEGLTEARGDEFLKTIANRLPEDSSNLKLGFRSLLEFDLSYSSLIQHRIRQYFYNLTPDTNTRPLSRRKTFQGEQESCFEQDVQELKQEIQANLQELHEEAVKSCEEALSKLLCEPSQIAYSMVEEFVDRVLRAEDVQEEWRKFLKKERLEVWLEFKQIAERVQERQNWIDQVKQAERINQLQAMQFLNAIDSELSG